MRDWQFPIVGGGGGIWSWLHIEDAATAAVSSAERGGQGVYLTADDRPLPIREWLPGFAEWVKAPPPPHVSVEDALKTEGGEDAV